MIGRYLPVTSKAVQKRTDGSLIQNFESTGVQTACWIYHRLAKGSDKKNSTEAGHNEPASVCYRTLLDILCATISGAGFQRFYLAVNNRSRSRLAAMDKTE
jgi:hypothetical protein